MQLHYHVKIKKINEIWKGKMINYNFNIFSYFIKFIHYLNSFITN